MNTSSNLAARGGTPSRFSRLVQSRLRRVAAILLGWLMLEGLLPNMLAQTSRTPMGILIYKGLPSESAKYHNALVYWNVKELGNRKSFNTGQSTPIILDQDLIASVVSFEVPGKGNIYLMNIEHEQDVEVIQSFSENLRSMTKASPKLGDVMDPICQEMERWLTLYRSGNVRLNGSWKSSLDLAAEKAARMQRTVVIAGNPYEAPKLIHVENDFVRFVHVGGVAQLDMSKLPLAERMLLARKLGIEDDDLRTSAEKRSAMTEAAMEKARHEQADSHTDKVALVQARGVGENLEGALAAASREALIQAAGLFSGSPAGRDFNSHINQHAAEWSKQVIKSTRKLASKHDTKGVTVIIQAGVLTDKLSERLKEMESTRIE